MYGDSKHKKHMMEKLPLRMGKGNGLGRT
jgi:hypothetical protein